jgi:MFS family permease
LAGIFVVFVGAALPLAFWLDAMTYVASALLIATIVVPPLAARAERSGGANAATDADANAPDSTEPGQRPPFLEEMQAGWRFLRRDSVLLANTLQATVAQFTVGVLIALAPVYAESFVELGEFGAEAAYSFMEAAIGVGNLAGGILMGIVGTRLAKGGAIISGYAIWGGCTLLLAFTGNLALVLGLMIGSGVANMVFVIPSQTLFQERTPADMIGRVIGFRFALVFGAMTLAMGAGGILGSMFPAPAVLGAAGLLTLVAGLSGLFVPAVRDA